MTDLPDWWPYDKQYEIMDCLEGMKQLPNKCVDLVLTDPPYGVGVDYGDTYDDTEDNLKEFIPKFMEQVLRVGKRAMITPGYNNIYKYPEPKHIIIWYNSAGSSLCSWGFSCWQPILCYGKDPYLQNRLGGRKDVIENIEVSDKVGHPCPKPLRLWEQIIKRGSVKDTDIILDPFMGSGTTLLAGRKTNRLVLGFELNPDYETVIQKRMMEEIPEIEKWF